MKLTYRALLKRRQHIFSPVECLDAESIAELVSANGDATARAAFADHAAACESCHAVVDVLFEQTAVSTESTGARLPLDTPATIDRYRVRRRAGAGGMGVVYVAHDPDLDREVAIKMLRRGVGAARLRREAQALARLSHPNVVAVYDVGEHDGQVFVAMALVDGLNFRQWMKSPHTSAEILAALCAAGRGIVAAHTAGLIHRDLKPDNIFVATGGDVLVGDFGLARDATDDEVGATPIAIDGIDLTQTGTVLGTPAYMAPEQADGRATEQSDQFSFCVMAYEALLGARPFAGNTLEAIVANVRAGKLTAVVRGRRVEAPVERALLRGLRADPTERFPTMADLLDALQPRSRKWPWIAVAGVIAVGGAVATTLVVTRESAADPAALCTSSGAPAWNPLIRGAVSAALKSHSNTPDAVAQLGRRLDQYATSWTAVRRDVCIEQVSARLTAVQATARIACLDTRKTTFEVTVASLLETSADVFATWRRVAMIPPAVSCNSDDAMRLSSAMPEHQALMRELATAINIDSRAIAAVVVKAEKTTDVPARLEVSLAQASDALDNTRPVEADAALERARPLAEQLDVLSVRVRAFALSARSLCIQARDAEADRFLALAQAGSQRLRESEHANELDEVFQAHTECLYRRKQFAELEPLLVGRLELVQQRYGREGLEAGELHQRLAQVYVQLDRPVDSAREYASSRAIQLRLVRTDEEAAIAEDGLGITSLQEGDLQGAIVHGWQSIEMLRALGHTDLVIALTSLGMLVEFSQDPRRAEMLFTEALTLIPADTTDEDLAVKRVEILEIRGLVRLQAGKLDAAIADLEVAIGGAKRFKRADFDVSARMTLARVWFAKHEYARAVRGFAATIEAYKASTGFTQLRSNIAEFEYAQASWETGDRARARTLGRLAESNVAKMVEGTKKPGLFHHLEPTAVALLADIERWRNAHP